MASSTREIESLKEIGNMELSVRVKYLFLGVENPENQYSEVF
jgi:hypothetical protein